MGVEAQDDQIYTGISETSNSGFNGLHTDGSGTKTDGLSMPSKQYYDMYNYDSVLEYSVFSNRILGDATGELGPFESNVNINTRQISSWYNSDAHFVGRRASWFARGDSYFYKARINLTVFGAWSASNNGEGTFRLILTP